VELMMATLITVFVLLGLLKAVEVAMEMNLRNQMRDEMTQVADARMNGFRSMTFSMISTCSNASCTDGVHAYASEPVASGLRGVNRSYTVFRTTKVSTDTNVSAVDLGVRVRSWVYKNMSSSWEMHTVKGE